MSDSAHTAPDLFSRDARRREDVLSEFEDAWLRSESPRIADHLPAQGPDRFPLLIELVHVDLEFRLRHHEPARIEHYLREFPELLGDRDALRELILREFELRGRDNPLLAAGEYVRRFPDFADELTIFRGAGFQPARETPTGRLETCPTARQAQPDTSLGRIGRFELREILGGGGFGVVYLADDPLLGRQVAVKVPRIDHQNAQATRRFLSEAKAAARLHHPGIVAVFECGQADGKAYIVSEYICGRTLADELTRRRPPLHTAVAWVAELAEALAYAHAQGVVHRDIKPENVLLDERDRPQIMDFGLAKRLDDASSTTVDGSIVGTPAYMAPEQARGEIRNVGPWSDQYSLGAVLYELLTGRRPFDGPPHTVVAQVAADDPPAPRSLNPAVPRDLEAICRQAMERDPARRYRSAAELAHDLRRWLAGHETQARPLSLIERAVRWGRKRPTVALLTASLVLVATIGFCLVLDQWRRAEDNRRAAVAHLVQAQKQRRRAEDNEAKYRAQSAVLSGRNRDIERQNELLRTSRQKLEEAVARERTNLAEAQRLRQLAEQRFAELQSQTQRADQNAAEAQHERQTAEQLRAEQQWKVAQSLLDKGETAAGLLWLARSLETTPADAPEFARFLRMSLALHRRNLHELRLMVEHPGPVTAVAAHPSDNLIATGSDDGTARIWNATTGEPVTPPRRYEGAVTVVAFRPDGRGLLVGSDDSTVELWEFAGGKMAVQPFEHPSAVHCAAFSAGGKLLVTGGADRMARVWNIATGKLSTPPLPHEGPVLAAAFSPDGRQLVTGTGGVVKKLTLWNVGLNRPAAVLSHGRDDIRAVAFHPDGKLIAAVRDDRTVQLWDALTGRPVAVTVAHDAPVHALAFSPDGRLLLTGSEDRTARVWDVATGRPVGAALQHSGAVQAVAFDATGRHIITGGADGTACVWHNAMDGDGEGPLASEATALAVAVSPDGSRLATGGEDRTARLWDATTGAAIGPPMQHSAAVTLVAFSPDGKTLLTGSADTTARLWSVATGHRAGLRMNHSRPVTAAAFRPDGRLVLTAGEEGTAHLWDASTGEPVGPPMQHRLAIRAVAFRPDGRLVLTAGDDRTARLWDAATGASHGRPLDHPDAVLCAAFAPDGRTVVTGCRDGSARQWNVETGELIGPAMAHQAGIRAVSVHPDGGALLTASDDGTARLWDAASGQPLGPPLAHDGPVTVAAFSPDGRLALTGSDDGTARLWDAATGRPAGPPLTHRGGVTAAAFGPQGTTLAVGVRGGPARMWRISNPLSIPAADVVSWAEVVTGRTLNENGQARGLAPMEWRQRRKGAVQK